MAAASDSSQPGEDRDNPTPHPDTAASIVTTFLGPPDSQAPPEHYADSPGSHELPSPDGQNSVGMNLSSYSNTSSTNEQPSRTKRRQVKNACTNCQKACKKCDDARPCMRCVKYGVAEDCIDSQRKERKKGVKRGPYKKRDGKGIVNPPHSPGQSVSPTAASGSMPTQGMPPIPYGYPPTMPYVGHPPGYPPGFYGQYPAPGSSRPGEVGVYYPQWYYAPGHQPSMMPSPHVPYYPPAFIPSYPNYMMSHPPAES